MNLVYDYVPDVSNIGELVLFSVQKHEGSDVSCGEETINFNSFIVVFADEFG